MSTFGRVRVRGKATLNNKNPVHLLSMLYDAIRDGNIQELDKLILRAKNAKLSKKQIREFLLLLMNTLQKVMKYNVYILVYLVKLLDQTW